MKVNKVRKIFFNMKISAKLSIMYLIILVFTIISSFFVYSRISYNITSRKNIEVSLQYLYAIKSNIYGIIETTSFNSKIIMANTDVQEILKDENSVNLSQSQRIVSNYLVSVIDSLTYIKSIYVFDNYSNRYGADKYYLKHLAIKRIDMAEWYKEVELKEGYYILKLNANSILENYENENTVSLLRIINDSITMEPIGTLMVNIDESAIKNSYKEIINESGTNIMILDENNDTISSHGEISNNSILELFEHNFNEENGSKFSDINGEEYLCSYMILPEYNWKIIICIPQKALNGEIFLYKIIFIIILLISGFFLLISVFITSNTITHPIKMLVDSMKQIENGRFVKVEMETGKDEIGQLKDNYNNMVDEIEKLICKIYKEQKFKRNAELKVLLEQIKPHFFYNTIDTMRYLALKGKNEELYDALEAFGGYYRTCLSKGKEIITIEEEISLVKDYLYLQQKRYGDTFSFESEIDPSTLHYKTLKLIIQPLVENSIYHGIIPKNKPGIIFIKTQLQKEFIVIEVKDDGVGMTQEELKRVKAENLENNMKSFGLRGTIERLNIYYERKDLYHIESEKGIGTRIIIKIPRED